MSVVDRGGDRLAFLERWYACCALLLWLKPPMRIARTSGAGVGMVLGASVVWSPVAACYGILFWMYPPTSMYEGTSLVNFRSSVANWFVGGLLGTWSRSTVQPPLRLGCFSAL